MKIFLSYSWKNKNEADIIDYLFKSKNINLFRDINLMQYKDNIENFMKEVKKSDYVIALISEHYLKSPNCMFEALQLLQDENYKERILPVVIDGTKIYGVMDNIEYIKYWNEEYNKVSEAIKGLSAEDTIAATKELKIIQMIKGAIGDFIADLKNMNLKTFNQLRASEFEELINEIKRGTGGKFSNTVQRIGGNKFVTKVTGNGNKVVNVGINNGDINL